MREFDTEIKTLEDKGIRPSHIRIKVLNFLMRENVHPTVDEIYEKLSKEIITLSKTTVYNTLKLLVEKGLVNVISIEGNELRYEAKHGFHGHFKCQSCDNVYDIAVSEIVFLDDIQDYQINSEQVLVTGLCPKCKP